MNDYSVEKIAAELEKQGLPAMMRRSDACRALGVAPSTLRQMRRDGQIVAIQISSQFRYDRREVARVRALGSTEGQ